MHMDFDDLYGTSRVLQAIARVQDTVNRITTQMGKLQVAFQDDINAIQAVLTDVSTQQGSLVTDVAAIKTELAAAGVTPAQLASLDTLASNAAAVQTALDSATASVGALAAPSTTTGA